MKYFGQIPTTVADRVILGEENTQGLVKDAVALNILQITAAIMQAKTDALVAADKAFNTSRSAQEIAYDNFHAADDALATWLGKVTGVLSASFGKRWSRQWVQVGFITPSIKLPAAITDRLALALRVISFFTTKPDYEAPNQGVTAAAGTALRASVVTTQNLATAADGDLANKSTTRALASDDLASQMRTLIGILAEVLTPDDPRWMDFGLSMPASLATPAAPTGLAAASHPALDAILKSSDGPTRTILLTCNAMPFATRYRFRMRILGLQIDFILVASSKEPMAIITVPADAAVEIIAQAVNGNRQSVPSDPIVYQPTPVATTKAPRAIVAEPNTESETTKEAPSRKGHTNGSRSS